jgi:hypothetical protein
METIAWKLILGLAAFMFVLLSCHLIAASGQQEELMQLSTKYSIMNRVSRDYVQ